MIQGNGNRSVQYSIGLLCLRLTMLNLHPKTTFIKKQICHKKHRYHLKTSFLYSQFHSSYQNPAEKKSIQKQKHNRHTHVCVLTQIHTPYCTEKSYFKKMALPKQNLFPWQFVHKIFPDKLNKKNKKSRDSLYTVNR